MSKSYAIYKLENKYDVLKQKIDGYTPGDLQIAAIVDGEETDEFPSYETNYKVLSVDCTNDATGTFDVESWRIAIDDMPSTSTKCTVSFDSTKRNQVEPINMTKKELIDLTEEIKNTNAKELANYLYPVGSIFTTTEISTVTDVEDKFGGTWVKYSEGKMLIGADENHEVNSTGGSSTITLSSSDIPSLNVTGTTDSTGSGYSISYGSASRTTNTTGYHGHSLSPVGNSNFTIANGRGSGVSGIPGATPGWGGYGSAHWFHDSYSITGSGNHAHTVADYYVSSISGVAAHTHTYTSTYTNDNQTSINIQNPYIVVYMYKRTA